MKAVGNKAAELQVIDPALAASYLRRNGWQFDDKFREIESYWRFSDGRQHTTLPLRPEAGDFALRMAELVDSVSAVEERSTWAVIRDLQTANMDVVSFKVDVGSGRDGTIPIRDGVKLFESARDTLVAAARSAVEARPLFQGGPPGEVGRYMNKVRAGQTERGSYIVNLLAPVAVMSRQQDEQDGQLFMDNEYESEVYFARSVTNMLSKALRSTQQAVESSRIDPTYRAFVNAVPRGVSANLCEALVRIHESGGEQAIQVNLRWAYTLPEHEHEKETFNFDSTYVPVLKEAATVLRATDPFENFFLLGEVVGLRRDQLLETGQVTIRANIEGKERRVLVDLGGSDYSRAVAAHDTGARVGVRGRLRNKNIKWYLENPRDFSTYEDRTFSY
jgi:hypothetical protein